MWDVIAIIALMAFGALALIVICSLIGWTIFWLQNGGKDE